MELIERAPASIAWALLALCLLLGLRRAAPSAWLAVVAAQLAGNTWGQISPGSALAWWPWLGRQLVYLALDLALLLQLTQRATQGRARTRLLARLALGTVALVIMAATLAPTQYDAASSSSWVAMLIRVDIIVACGYLSLGLILVWHCRPMGGLDGAILSGAAILRVLHGLALWCWQSPGWRGSGNLFAWAECAILAWWLLELGPRSAQPAVALP